MWRIYGFLTFDWYFRDGYFFGFSWRLQKYLRKTLTYDSLTAIFLETAGEFGSEAIIKNLDLRLGMFDCGYFFLKTPELFGWIRRINMVSWTLTWSEYFSVVTSSTFPGNWIQVRSDYIIPWPFWLDWYVWVVVATSSPTAFALDRGWIWVWSKTAQVRKTSGELFLLGEVRGRRRLRLYLDWRDFKKRSRKKNSFPKRRRVGCIESESRICYVRVDLGEQN